MLKIKNVSKYISGFIFLKMKERKIVFICDWVIKVLFIINVNK